MTLSFVIRLLYYSFSHSCNNVEESSNGSSLIRDIDEGANTSSELR